MAEEFEGRDLSDSVFWGVDMQRVLIRDANLTGARIAQARLVDVTVDGVIDRLVVNGVDVTDHVNSGDRWYPLRTMLRPVDVPGVIAAWDLLQRSWGDLHERVERLGADAVTISVDGEWSYRDTLRHLLFVMDKWFAWPLTGQRRFTPIGLANSGSAAADWPGLERDAEPTWEEVLAARAASVDRFGDYLRTMPRPSETADRGATPTGASGAPSVSGEPRAPDADRPDGLAGLPDMVEVPENGSVPGAECLYVVLEEEFEHLRYATRDVERLEAGTSG